MRARLRTAALRTVACSAWFACGAAVAKADVLASVTRADFQRLYPHSPTALLLDLDAREHPDRLYFATSQPSERVVITYNAQCGVQGGLGSFVSISISVDGLWASPGSSSGAFAFCSGSNFNDWNLSTGVRQTVAVVPNPGTHQVAVVAQLRNGATGLEIRGGSLVVRRPPVMATATRLGTFTSTVRGPVQVPLKGRGQDPTEVAFSTTAPNQLVAITYNAECGVLGSPETYVSMSIEVDGAQAAPASGDQFAFCSAVSAVTYGYLGAFRQSFFRVPGTGAHKAVVMARLSNGATRFWLGDSSLVVSR